ncbi:MAG: hypothetical protein ACK2T0_05810 [Anaerolineales bacterium]
MRTTRLLLSLTLAAILGACSLGRQPEPTPIPSPTLEPSPTPVPTPDVPLAVLVVPADMDATASDQYQKTVYELAQESGMRYQVRNSYTVQDLDPMLRVLIAVPPDPGIAALAEAAPRAQFLAINIPGVSAGGNISVLATTNQVDIPAFIAGYTAALISDDFRAGMIMPKDDPLAQQAATAFANGMGYYCGLCTGFRLYIDQNGGALSFPQFVQIPSDQDPGQLGGWANYAVGSLKISALYLYPDPKLEVKQLLDGLGQTGAMVIGAAPPDPKPSGWVMEIGPDEVKAIQTAWPQLVAGQGGISVPSPLGLRDVDPVLLSPGRQRLVEGVLDDIQAGRILTGAGP